MICIAITAAALDAVVATLPIGAVAYEAQLNAKGERLIWIERLWAAQAAARSPTRRVLLPRPWKPCGTTRMRLEFRRILWPVPLSCR
jgi:hypothetical protein